MMTDRADPSPPVDDTGQAVTARHGNLRPWQPGQSGNPGGTPTATREALRLAREASPAAMRLLIAMMNDPTEDSRARIVAATHILDRALGKPKETQPGDAAKPDLAMMTDAELAAIARGLAG